MKPKELTPELEAQLASDDLNASLEAAVTIHAMTWDAAKENGYCLPTSYLARIARLALLALEKRDKATRTLGCSKVVPQESE